MNNTNATTNEEELDEELGDFQLPLSLTPRASASTGHTVNTTNVILQHRPSSASVQHNVVLHSTISESSMNRFDLNVPIDPDDRILGRRKTNSLTPVQEQGSTHDLLNDDSRTTTIPTSHSDIIHRPTTDDKQTV